MSLDRTRCGDENGHSAEEQRRLLARFWRTASGFWRGHTGWGSWTLAAALISIVVLQLFVQYHLNIWNRDFFNALERRDGHALWIQAQMFLPLVTASVALAVCSVWGRMTAQRRWREWLSRYLIETWLGEARYARLNLSAGKHQNPEFRIVEDARMATDAPIDFAIGLLTALLTAITFISVLWNVGGALAFEAFGQIVVIPGYLVVGAAVYAAIMTGTMLRIGRRLTNVIESKNQAEADMISAGSIVRETAPSAGMGEEQEQKKHVALRVALRRVLATWHELCRQLMRTTVVSQSNLLLAPAVGWLLCSPKYLSGTMSLGELTQAAAAFVIVQGAFGWLVDNYNRVADWISSANRVVFLMEALDEVAPLGSPADAAVSEGQAPAQDANRQLHPAAQAGWSPVSANRAPTH